MAPRSGRFLNDNRGKSACPDFSAYPLHKRLADFKGYSTDVLAVLKAFLKLKISISSLQKLQKRLLLPPTLFELKVLNSFWSSGKGHLNRKISEIQIVTENPHLLKALELYNGLRKDNVIDGRPRTLNDLTNMAYTAAKDSGAEMITDVYGNLVMQRNVFDRGVASKYYLSLNTVWDKLGFSACNKAILDNLAKGYLPFGAIYKEYGESDVYGRFLSAKEIDGLEIPVLESNECHDVNFDNSAVKFSLLGISDKACVNGGYLSGTEKILLIKPNYSQKTVKDFYKIVEEGLSGLATRVVTCTSGILNDLIAVSEGFDINMNQFPLKEMDIEDFVLSPTNSYLIVLCKGQNVKKLKEILKSLDFSGYVIGRLTTRKLYRFVNADVEFMRLNSSVVKYRVHDYTICRLEDSTFELGDKLYDNFDESKVEDYLIKQLELGYFKADDVLSGVSSGDSVYPPYLGKNQLTPMQSIILSPANGRYGENCVLMASNNVMKIGKDDFSVTINEIVSALMKLVVSGVPLCDIAINTNLLYDAHVNRYMRGTVLSVCLASLYAQKYLAIGTLGNSVDLIALGSNMVVSDVTAVGTASRDHIITSAFKSGDMLYRFRIPRDEYDVPDFKFVIKFASHVYMNINVGNITAGCVVENNVIDSIIKGTIGDRLGFSFAKIDEDTFKNATGDIILAVNEEWDFDSFGGEYLGVVDDTGAIKGADSTVKHSEIERYVTVYPFKNDIYRRVGTIVSVDKPTPKAMASHVEINALILHTDSASERAFASTLNSLGYAVRSVAIPDSGNRSSNFARSLREQILYADLIIVSGRGKAGSTHDGVYNVLKNPIVLDALNEQIFNNSALVLGTGEGARALLELGYLGKGTAENGKPQNIALDYNEIPISSARLPRVKITNNYSPFLSEINLGETYLVSSAGEKQKFTFTDRVELYSSGQIAMQYVDYLGYPTILFPFNPYGSQMGVAALSSPDGRILGLFNQPELVTGVKGEQSLLEKILLSAKKYFE